MDREPKIDEMVNTVFNLWQQQDLMKHKRLTLKMVRVIKDAFLYYSMIDICDAIRNYNKIYNDSRSWFKVKYPIDTFISEKMDRFLNENNPMQTHYNGQPRSGARMVGGQPPPSQPTISPDSLENFNERFKQWKREKQK